MRQTRRKFLRVFYIVSIVLCGTCSLHAQYHIIESPEHPVSLRPYAELLIEGEKSYTESDIPKLAETKAFSPLSDFKENLGFSEGAYWMRFKLTNDTETVQYFFLETGRPITDYVTLYLKDASGNIRTQHSGDAIPFARKTISNRKSVFRIGLEPRETLEAFIHLVSDGEVVMLPLDLIPQKTFLYGTYREQLFYGFFYGILVLACIIYLFFYSAMRDTAFVYYGLYVLFIAMLQFSLDGLFHQYVMPGGGYLSRRAVLFAALLSLFFFVNYGRTFLNIQKYSRKLLLAFKSMSALTVITVLALLTVPAFLPYCYPLANHIGLGILLLTIFSIVVIRMRKVPVDMFFIVGISFLILGFVVFILNNLNMVPNSFITENGAKFGIGLEIIFLSLSMGNRIRNLRESNEHNQLLALQRSEDMNDMKSSFISNISHELRTPLNLIMGVAATLKEDKRDVELREKCKLILSSSETLLGHVDDILDFTSIEKGEQELNEDAFDLKIVLDRVVRLNRNKAVQKELDFTYTLQERLPHKIVGDRRKLIQVLNNLLDNAVKFTSEGEVQFHVGHQVKNGDSVRLSFAIKDTGIGISKEKMSTIYESFTKNSSADKREFYGLGLGLYIVKSNVDLQNGNIRIQNGKQEGTECLVELDFKLDAVATAKSEEVTKRMGHDYTHVPIHAPAIDKKERDAEGIDKKSVNPPKRDLGKDPLDLGGCRILLVEDNKMNQMMVKMCVKKWQNVSLDIADNGEDGLEMLQKSSYDIVLMDLQMPVMDGFEATANIRAGKAGAPVSDIPILVVTADATEATKKEVFRLGASDYMTKPFKSELLFSKIRKNLVVHSEKK